MGCTEVSRQELPASLQHLCKVTGLARCIPLLHHPHSPHHCALFSTVSAVAPDMSGSEPAGLVGPAGYSDGSGVVRGLGRGLAGAVGLPLGGALAAISAVSAGLAAAAGVSTACLEHRQLLPGKARTQPSRTLRFPLRSVRAMGACDDSVAFNDCVNHITVRHQGRSRPPVQRF